MCLAVRIVVIAPSRDRRLALRRAATSAEWEVVADAEDVAAGVGTARSLRARFVVVDHEAATDADVGEMAAQLAAQSPPVFVVGVGDVSGCHATVAADDLARLRGVMAELLHTSGDHRH